MNWKLSLCAMAVGIAMMVVGAPSADADSTQVAKMARAKVRAGVFQRLQRDPHRRFPIVVSPSIPTHVKVIQPRPITVAAPKPAHLPLPPRGTVRPVPASKNKAEQDEEGDSEDSPAADAEVDDSVSASPDEIAQDGADADEEVADDAPVQPSRESPRKSLKRLGRSIADSTARKVVQNSALGETLSDEDVDRSLNGSARDRESLLHDKLTDGVSNAVTGFLTGWGRRKPAPEVAATKVPPRPSAAHARSDSTSHSRRSGNAGTTKRGR